MLNSPIITVITVVYNSEKQLEQTIQSVINQTYANIEYIVIDGGSTDGSTEIIKKYNDKISKWVSEPDKGIYDGMNKGVLMALGEYVNFMNAGDSFYSDTIIEDLMSRIDSNIDLFYGNIELIKGNQKTGIVKKAGKLKNIKKRMPFCHQAVFVRRRFLLEYPFDLKYRVSADYHFFVNLNLISSINEIYYSNIICFYDIEGVSTGTRLAKENLQIITKFYPYSVYVIYHFYLLFVTILYRFYFKITPNNIKLKIHNLRNY
jgi:glycosyltransferase involved in cell wall biosynthesis